MRRAWGQPWPVVAAWAWLCACASQVSVASEVDEEALSAYCRDRCDYYATCEQVDRDDCEWVCLDGQNPVRLRLRAEAVQALAGCFAGLSCSEKDDICLDLQFELTPDPELMEACAACGIEEAVCNRALALTDQKRSESRSCLLDTCGEDCLGIPFWR